jgi:proton-coupled amino acid transporter
LAKIVILVITVAIFFSYALQFYVPLEILLPVVTAWAPSRPLLAEFALRYSLVILTCQ